MRGPLRPVAGYIAAMACAAAVLLALWMWAWRDGPPHIPMAGALIVLGAFAQQFYVPVAPRRKVDLSIAVYFASLLLLGAPAAMVSVGAAQLLGQSTLALRRDPRSGRHRRSPRSVLFNTAQFMVATGLAGFVYYGTLPHEAPAQLGRLENLWALPAAALTMYLANSLAVAGVVGLQRGQSLRSAWLTGRRAAGLYLMALCGIAALTLRNLPHDPWAAILLVLSGVVVYSAIERSVRLAEQVRVLARLEERERIAMDLHDGAIQSLFAATLSLAAEERALDGSMEGAEAAARTRAALRRTRSQLNRVMQDIRSYVHGLRVHDLGRDDLQTGLRTLAEELRLSTPISPHLDFALDPQIENRLAGGAVESLLHITREATSNVIRHSAATEVTIAVSQPDAQHLRLTIRDNGRGFASSQAEAGNGDTLHGQGLHNMSTRALALGGELAVLTEPGSGTEVRLDVPLAEN